jgi:hypothetical protein
VFLAHELLDLSYFINNIFINVVSRKEEVNDGILCIADGDQDDQGEAYVPPSIASWGRNCEEVVPQATAIYLPGLHTDLQVLRLLPCSAHKIPSPSPPGESDHVFQLLI